MKFTCPNCHRDELVETGNHYDCYVCGYSVEFLEAPKEVLEQTDDYEEATNE